MNNKLINEDKQQVLIFSDLDGTLLDHYSYDHIDAKPSMDRLASQGVPIIPNTSKTFAEVLILREKLKLNGPFIVENGAAIYIDKDFLPAKPKGAIWKDGFWRKTFSPNRNYWLGLIKKTMPEYHSLFESFSEMSLERLSELTGLSLEEANLASQRQFGEPLYWKGSETQLESFVTKLEGLGAHPVKGGRFLHVGGNCSKGVALSWLLKEYQRQHKELSLITISLGDGNNDIAMLEAADIAIRIASPVHEPPKLSKTERVYTSTEYGPRGWAEILDQLLP
jgi:mannosyl-3-phosphoglycerate phosphatase